MMKWPKYCVFLLFVLVTGCAKDRTNNELFNAFQSEGFDAQETDQGVMVLLPDVFFNFDSDQLTPVAYEKLLTIGDILADPKINIQRNIIVEGHTDSIGSAIYNEDLSLRRANSVANQLVSRGIDPNRIVRRGYGSKYPIAPNTTADGYDNPEGRAKNRRVNVILENLSQTSVPQ